MQSLAAAVKMSHDKYNNYLPNTWNTYSLDGVFQMVVGREKTDILDKCALNDSSVNVWRYENKLQYIQYLLRQQSLIENETGRTFYEVCIKLHILFRYKNN